MEAQLSGQAAITTALSGMLEVLPKGASKGAGLQVVLEKLGVAPENVLAMGDAENDLEMLTLAGVCSSHFFLCKLSASVLGCCWCETPLWHLQLARGRAHRS